MKIIVHIGAGKTGTSSIQTTLHLNQALLNQQGFHYLGLTLKHATIQKYSWQSSPAGNFQALENKVAIEEVMEVLEVTIADMEKKGIHTLIWSNESFFTNSQKMVPILKRLEKNNEIEIILYLREHHSWIASAYKQWGIKHKTYKGKIQSFKEWYRPKRVDFYQALRPYLENFEDRTKIKNMRVYHDVVKNFLTLCGIDDSNIIIQKSNESLSNEELLLRALYNNHFESPLLPTPFEKKILKPISKNFTHHPLTPSEYLRALLPSSDEMLQVAEDTKEDRALLNRLFEAQGEERFSNESQSTQNSEIDDSKLLMLLTRIVLKQSIDINRLKQEIIKLKES